MKIAGYPTEVLEVTGDIAADWSKYAVLVGHPIPFENVDVRLSSQSK